MGELGKCLVLGGGGFLGRAIVARLLREGENVQVMGRHEYPALTALGAECVRGDVRELETLRAVCTGCSTVFHTVAICDVVKERKPYFDVNVHGTENVLKACREAGVRNLIYTSTPSVVVGLEDVLEGDESLPYAAHYLSPYPESKAEAERLVLAETSLRTCALRPHLMWSEDDPHIIPAILKLARANRLTIVGDGRNRVSLTHVENAAQAHVQAARELAGTGRCAGKAYFVNDTEPVVLWDWINDFLVRMELEPVRRHVPYRLAYAVAACVEAVSHLLPCLPALKLNRFVVSQLAHSHYFTHRRATEDFGYRPELSPEDGLERMVQVLRSRMER